MCCCCRKSLKNLTKTGFACWVVSLGLVLTVGIVLVAIKDVAFDAVIDDNFVLTPNSQLYENWRILPTPIITSIYFFNVTNPKEVLNGAKPKLVEVGPYVFQQMHEKVKMVWNDHNHTVTYQQIRTWKFDEEKTDKKLTMSDNIVTLNAAAATVNAIAKNLPGFLKLLLVADLAAVHEKLFITKNVSQLLFDGYEDPILTQSTHLPDKLVPMKMDKFGYFYPRNGSDWYDGVWNIYTGVDDVTKMDKVYSWNYTHNLPYFPGACSEVRGAGDFFSPGQDKTFVELFSNDLCRPLKLDFVNEDKRHAINGNVYKMSDKYFANGTVNPENKCFNPHNEVPSGVFNVSTCRFGAPVFMSQPHFFQADPYYLNGVAPGSLKPEEKKHETEFFVEPKSGLPVEVAARFQVNFLIEPVSMIPMFESLRKTFFPTVWFETKILLPPSMNAEVWLVANLSNMLLVIGWLLIGLAVGGAAVVVTCFVTQRADRCRSSTGVARQNSGNPILNSSIHEEAEEEQRVALKSEDEDETAAQA